MVDSPVRRRVRGDARIRTVACISPRQRSQGEGSTDMVGELVESVQDLPIPFESVWDALIEPDTYARLFDGIGGCDRQQTADDRSVSLYRIGTEHAGIATVPVRMIPGRRRDTLELYSPTLGSLVLIRLRRRDEGTRIAVTF